MATVNATNTSFPATVPQGGLGVVTLTSHGVMLGSGTGAVSVTAEGVTGKVLTGVTGGDPTWQDPAGGGLSWSVVTGLTQAPTVNSAYICNNASGVTVTLPDTAAVGDIVRVVGSSGIWVLAQNSGETVYLDDLSTTTGTSGTLTAGKASDCIELVCIVANTDWRVISSMGNITPA